MSKMTVVNETSADSKRYKFIQPVEFYEMIGRVADVRFRESSGLELYHKIEYILDELLPLIGATRREVYINVEESSCSDNEY